ncbi:DUF4229 domain-containing protein [Sanguibacter sp. A247]|uniref:DUF4229 domain-containing protein n=1 Tax=unclassified Sanguibacter TaxID=2645534 RepID=UPI003FD87FDD
MPLVAYTLWRVLIFVAVLPLLWWAGARGPLLLLLAVVLTFLVSLLALRGPRDRAALWLAERAEAKRVRQAQGTDDPDAAAEDAETSGS